MNYFEIFNKVLLELNYRPQTSFETIYKSGHTKILDAINRVNKEVLASYKWPFLERATFLDTIEDVNAYELPFRGMIKSVYDGPTRLQYTPEAEELLMGRISGNYYSVMNNRIILPKCRQEKTFKVIYFSESYVLGADGAFKTEMTQANDCSILPMPFGEYILVYGTCLKVKANPAYPKFGFWNTMYIQALGNLRQKSSRSGESEPFIKI